MNRKIWTCKDFDNVFLSLENHLSSKHIAHNLGITTNALYKALQRFRKYEKKIKTNRQESLVNRINERELLMLAQQYGIPTKNQNTVQIIRNINDYRSRYNLSKLLLNY